ncbi:MAG: iron ABC transporter permease [Eubacteriaceae bacterium]|nr:iron ABC transporter permease [Eubacteriaceae bacterium]
MNIKNVSFTTISFIYLSFFLLTTLVCIAFGSVSYPIADVLATLGEGLQGKADLSSQLSAIILMVRVPRVLCVGLVGACLATSGAAMQGPLKNPLADGSTLGVSSGATLGAVFAIALGLQVPGFPLASTIFFAVLSAFLSLVFILTLAYQLDRSLATHTIILIGIIFGIFVQSLVSLLLVFANEKVKDIVFWTMGSLSGTNYTHVAILAVTLLLFGSLLLSNARELDAFAIGEDDARHIGVDVKKTRLTVLIASSALVGVCVAIGGSIGFVGLVVPHMMRIIVGPNHNRLLPSTIVFGSCFLMLSDLVARIIVRPIELPVGVVTSLIGSVVFVFIFYRGRKTS